MDDELARRLDRITALLGAILAVQLLVLFAIVGFSLTGFAAAFVVAGLLVALVGGVLTDANPFGGTDRPRGR
ncbi:hypothetical protein [Saliphagus sp. LR7]|uniref:hypothetical protein n=1 Tax=Saliphagus sp. LR7 TaxID=2282654 RepID=UPI000DF7397A|nr:hypothetical protein [Saliphagus sp. LR7]